MMKATSKEDKAMWECYRLLYENSNPQANFDELVENAEFNERGQKVIDFDSYEIEESKFFEIMDDVIKRKHFEYMYLKFTLLKNVEPE